MRWLSFELNDDQQFGEKEVGDKYHEGAGYHGRRGRKTNALSAASASESLKARDRRHEEPKPAALNEAIGYIPNLHGIKVQLTMLILTMHQYRHYQCHRYILWIKMMIKIIYNHLKLAIMKL